MDSRFAAVLVAIVLVALARYKLPNGKRVYEAAIESLRSLSTPQGGTP